MFIKSALL